MAVDMIKTVRRAMDFELGMRQPSQSSSIASIASSWETCRDGLLSGEALAIELQKLQTDVPSGIQAFVSISRRHLRFQFRGLVEKHEGRSAVARPSGKCLCPIAWCVGCTLTLVKHKYRISATQSSYAEQKAEDFRTDKIPIQSIAVTTGAQGSNGKFDPTYSYGIEYYPFEGAGLVSKWAIELANELRQMDYSAITDIELDITYSALAAGYKQAALNAAAKDLETVPSVVSIDLINEIGGDGEEEVANAAAGEIVISGVRKRLPHIISRGEATLKGVELYLKSRTGLRDDLTAKFGITPLDTVDSLGDFRVLSSEEKGFIFEPWTVTLKDGKGLWEGTLDEAWLLISYTVSGLVKG
ncbi:hypothetical protein BJX66DRAFT_333303 [Aspergillus keveii]|uniref:Tc toxin complex TcA C-terminal TcB-binding domain-containing protein n=1 Tax=Aspergillus keveii TaxID=714993 RepID=A0ABR4GK09_9EURO